MRDRNFKKLEKGDKVTVWNYGNDIFIVVGRNSGKGPGQNSDWIMVENNEHGMIAAYESELTKI